jgi:hypothetical protein
VKGLFGRKTIAGVYVACLEWYANGLTQEDTVEILNIKLSKLIVGKYTPSTGTTSRPHVPLANLAVIPSQAQCKKTNVYQQWCSETQKKTSIALYPQHRSCDVGYLNSTADKDSTP